MNPCLQARIIDMHTVFLGNGERWIRLSLAWLARDLADLIRSIRSGSTGNAADAQRLLALRLVLAKLEAKEAPADNPPPIATLCPITHFRLAALSGQDQRLPQNGPAVWCCHPSALLDLETVLAGRDPYAVTALLVVSSQAVIVSPVMQVRQFCPLCLRYLVAPVFGLETDEAVEEKAMADAGLALARTVERKASDSLIFDRSGLQIQAFAPFIGCPQCLAWL